MLIAREKKEHYYLKIKLNSCKVSWRLFPPNLRSPPLLGQRAGDCRKLEWEGSLEKHLAWSSSAQKGWAICPKTSGHRIEERSLGYVEGGLAAHIKQMKAPPTKQKVFWRNRHQARKEQLCRGGKRAEPYDYPSLLPGENLQVSVQGGDPQVEAGRLSWGDSAKCPGRLR